MMVPTTGQNPEADKWTEDDTKNLLGMGEHLRAIYQRHPGKSILGIVTLLLVTIGAVVGFQKATGVVPTTDVAAPTPQPVKSAAPASPASTDDADLKAIKSWIDAGNADAAARHKECLAASKELLAAVKALVPPTPTPTPADEDAVSFEGPAVAELGTVVKVKAKLGKGASSLLFGPAPGTTASVEIVDDTAIIIPKVTGDVWLIASCVRDGKSAGPLTWRVQVKTAPQPPPPPIPVSKLTEAELKEWADAIAYARSPQSNFQDAITGLARIAELDAKAMGLALPAPTPLPPLPPPVDAFTKSVQDAWALDGKSPKVAILASLYKLSPATVNNTAYIKHKDILDAMHAAAQIALGEPDPAKASVLPNVRRVLATEFNSAIGGKTNTMLDTASRQLIAAEFLKAQKALEACK